MSDSRGSRSIAEITLVHPELVLTPTIEAVPEMESELEYQTIAAPGTYYLFFKVTGDSFDPFEAALATDPTVSEPTVIIDGGEFRVYRMRLTSAERLVLPEAAALGLRILHATSGRGGWIATLEVPALETLQAFRAYCRDRDVEFTVDRLYHANEGEQEASPLYGLTPVQRETLRLAYERGYFEEPRDASVEDLAAELGISSSAVSSRLRRALEALVANTVAR
ncbi:helix-turn-helix domain-containing protein [Natrinema salaciae]|uniref:GAF and HTH_10 associated domain-containing protein n=1 Tax=Natrinema salaciae TaxID=1186196 RepID=A0A1H9PZT2_9EURY|nr:helix-turn-helix domain-containing protein [Natrinema salaciae]SER53694.1 GAF and HTH_10 associated domain-containing protein [Natrinema salaciae]